MPPPNANGSLHFGHALFIALEDLMIRYQRMRGKKLSGCREPTTPALKLKWFLTKNWKEGRNPVFKSAAMNFIAK